MKLFSLIGSWAGENSRTGRFGDLVAEKILEELSGDGCYEKWTADRWNIDFCRSCGTCFQEGKCQIEGDEMEEIQRRILDADILILGSPVYAVNISGSTKNLIDRLSLWLHTMPLIGTVCAVISTTGTNHPAAAVDYLSSVMRLMGAAVPVAECVYTGMGSPGYYRERELRPLIDKMSHTILSAVGNEKVLTPQQSDYYEQQLRRYRKIEQFAEWFSLRAGEAELWRKQGYFECETMLEALRRSISARQIGK